MVEGVEEFGREPHLYPFSDVEILVQRQVCIPGAGAQVKSSRTGIVELHNRSVARRAVRERLWKTVVKVGSEWPHQSLPSIHRHESCKVPARDIGSECGIKVSPEPQPLPPPENSHFQALICVERGIAQHVATGIHAAPEAASPISDECHMPAANHGVQWPSCIPDKCLASAKGQFVDAVETNAMGRDIG